MINEPHYISPGQTGFKGKRLDAFLAAGYYRMQHLIFTTHYTQIDMGGGILPVFWLRSPVKNIKEHKAASMIRKKCVAFTVQYKNAIISDEVESLYTLYESHVNFITAPSCSEVLHQQELDNPFDSWMIEIRDNNKLIAVGFFDKGENAITGILNFYHPDYNKYSLGKYLILKKVDYALENNIALYYTGYLSTAISKFDYKLFPDAAAIEVYLPLEKQWVPYGLLGKQFLEDYFFTRMM